MLPLHVTESLLISVGFFGLERALAFGHPCWLEVPTLRACVQSRFRGTFVQRICTPGDIYMRSRVLSL